MKRLFFILFFFGLMLCACGREYGILDYQEKNISAECLINSKYRVQITKDDALCRVEILEPTEASGISFEISERGVFAKAKDFEMEIPGEYLEGICAIGSIFSQSEEFLSSATQKEGGSVFTFQRDGCTYQITVGENSAPKKVCIYSESFEYDIEICSIELK